MIYQHPAPITCSETDYDDEAMATNERPITATAKPTSSEHTCVINTHIQLPKHVV